MPEFWHGIPEMVQIQSLNHESFWYRRAQLNTSVATFFNFDWTNGMAECFVCDGCGCIHWFLPER